MDKIEFIKATAKDIQILVDSRILFSDELTGKQEAQSENNLRKSLRHYFKREINKSYYCWYVTINGQMASIGGMTIRVQPGNVKNPSGVWGYIMGVYTVPKHRKKGLSKRIMEKLIDTAKEAGIHALELHATKTGESVYIKTGFEIHNQPTYRKYI